MSSVSLEGASLVPCPTCTYSNPSDALFCEMCTTWVCKQCTAQNVNTKICLTCGSMNEIKCKSCVVRQLLDILRAYPCLKVFARSKLYKYLVDNSKDFANLDIKSIKPVNMVS